METTKKIVLLGQFGVGKTSLVRRFMTDEFSANYKTTLGVQIKKKVIDLPSGNKLSMVIWDLEGFSSVSKTRISYLIGTNALIHVFDLTRAVTYANLEEEINYLKKKYPDVLIRTVGNKSDEKNPESINRYLKSKNITVFDYISAKTGQGVAELFNDIAVNINNYE